MQHDHNVNLPPEATDAVKEVSETAKDVKRGLRRIKQHLQDNKRRYLIGGGVIGGTAVVGGSFALGRMTAPLKVVTSMTSEASSTVGDVAESATVAIDQSLTFIQHINGAGRMYKIIEDLDNPGALTKKINTVATELAEEFNVPFETARKLLSQHVNGHSPHVFGRHFRIAGVSAE
jgi:hypothetical protein